MKKKSNGMGNAWILYAFIVLGIALFYIRFHRYLGHAFFNIASAALLALFLIVVFAAGITAVKAVGTGSPQGKAMFYMTSGFGFWVVGSLIYAPMVILNRGFANAGADDIMWGIGYLLIVYGVINGIKASRSLITAKGIAWLGIFFAVLLALGIKFLFYPVLASQGISAIEKIAFVLPPLFDILLVVGAAHMVIALGMASTGRAWAIIMAGIFIVSFADAMFSYLVWNSIYFNSPRVIDIARSIMVNTFWAAGYLLVAMGFCYQSKILAPEFLGKRR